MATLENLPKISSTKAMVTNKETTCKLMSSALAVIWIVSLIFFSIVNVFAGFGLVKLDVKTKSDTGVVSLFGPYCQNVTFIYQPF